MGLYKLLRGESMTNEDNEEAIKRMDERYVRSRNVNKPKYNRYQYDKNGRQYSIEIIEQPPYYEAQAIYQGEPVGDPLIITDVNEYVRCITEGDEIFLNDYIIKTQQVIDKLSE